MKINPFFYVCWLNNVSAYNHIKLNENKTSNKNWTKMQLNWPEKLYKRDQFTNGLKLAMHTQKRHHQSSAIQKQYNHNYFSKTIIWKSNKRGHFYKIAKNRWIFGMCVSYFLFYILLCTITKSCSKCVLNWALHRETILFSSFLVVYFKLPFLSKRWTSLLVWITFSERGISIFYIWFFCKLLLYRWNRV